MSHEELARAIGANLSAVRRKVQQACQRSGRSPQDVAIVAVTKSAPIEAIAAVLSLGQVDLGESRPQQLVDRSAQLRATLAAGAPAPRWHMIGHLQRNKVRAVLDACEMIHSVDSLRLAEEIDQRAERAGRQARVLLQVNCSQEAQKFGVAVGAAVHMAELLATFKNLRLEGLMTMGPLSDDAEAVRPAFRRLRELFEEIRGQGIGAEHFRHLSMGMSQDYPVAVEEGATILRLGSVLFEGTA